ncbi:hypothetical protein F889_02460 [Acinetobacter colistiniresistens]|uniref:Uncharacterized protein n=1 Tax=Acinetobacter colistiniresistens TaxID=280145 RepID=N9R3R6_9GAMM|nr:hypothetical protein [Acinetobacter colistiniresistens]ENX33797.1 hypothetical protein F889_02460 [Acinetobacter colistiniresistens]
MSMNPMELLKQKVSSMIVNDQTCLVNEKNDVLSRFYPIFLSIFLDKPELIDQLKEKLTPSVLDLLEENARVKNALLIRLAAGKVAVTEVEITLNRAIPKSLAVLSNEVGNEAISILHYLREHKESIFALLPNWSDEVLALLDEGEIKEALLETIHEPVELPPEKKSYRLFPFLTLIFASFSLLFLYHLTK